jgi:hypothetical protein
VSRIAVSFSYPMHHSVWSSPNRWWPAHEHADRRAGRSAALAASRASRSLRRSSSILVSGHRQQRPICPSFFRSLSLRAVRPGALVSGCQCLSQLAYKHRARREGSLRASRGARWASDVRSTNQARRAIKNLLCELCASSAISALNKPPAPPPGPTRFHRQFRRNLIPRPRCAYRGTYTRPSNSRRAVR